MPAGPFSGGSIRHMIENPVYAGFIAWHQRNDKGRPVLDFDETLVTGGAHEPLWPAPLWEQIVAVRKRQFRGAIGGKVRNPYPFRKIVVCDLCERPMYGEPHGGGGGRPRTLYYACITARERHACPQMGVRVSAIDDHFGRWLAECTRIPAEWETMIAKINVGVGGDPTVDVGALRRQLERVGERYELGDLSPGASGSRSGMPSRARSRRRCRARCTRHRTPTPSSSATSPTCGPTRHRRSASVWRASYVSPSTCGATRSPA